MAQFKKIQNSKFETDKIIIICGKGKTVEKVEKLDKNNKLIACLNSSTVFVENVDFLFINDQERLESLLKLEKNPEKVKNLILPIQPHKNFGPSNITYLDCVKTIETFDWNVYTYSLYTQNIKDPETEDIDKIRFGPETIHSTLHTSLFWLIESGFRKFEIYGVGNDSQYADVYNQNAKSEIGFYGKKQSESWYKQNKSIAQQILERNNCQDNFN